MRIISILLPVVCLSAPLWAQRYSGAGYGFFSLDRPGGASLGDVLTVGGGGEALLFKGVGIGADIGYQFPRGSGGSGIGIATLNGCYHFVNRQNPGKVVPFVTAGYGVGFRSGAINLYNYGGGANFWFSRHLGFRAELRDYRTQNYDYAVSLRFGLAFR
jgi:hypothetical protein